MKKLAQPAAIYTDNVFDRLALGLINRKIAQALGLTPPPPTYANFVWLSQQVMQGRTAQEQQALIAKVLASVIPRWVLGGIRTIFSPAPLVCELNAWFATRLFQWLVGPCEWQATLVAGPDQAFRWQRSRVQIKKCRYLEESGCVGMCVNLCKLPTQKFFTEQFGIPLTMSPDFEDLSCAMVFGQMPLPFNEEEAAQQPCLHSDPKQAPLPCPKL
ncbi:DUF4033 domain-containing protein [Thermosynechococcaceae cyanobacterium BACA0444]|uniref:DUF4033 domain-containing protein n=1 Tax=Pseudocalidococcus azoricus BACA0444 TaxID=2918990 RepID=A0AAE4FR10_9CYAN|nr:DUF4033 domain-containing protein [Pseudocalidococcus azoricus]MDS3860703.1 DUF4033 domain-containing protein [Pseudocalidococcus azoricus BACA0444]